jgi:hypothetical protein
MVPNLKKMSRENQVGFEMEILKNKKRKSRRQIKTQ